MADQFQSIQSGGGLLKDYYDAQNSPVSAALRKRSKKLHSKIVVPTKEDLEGDKDE